MRSSSPLSAICTDLAQAIVRDGEGYHQVRHHSCKRAANDEQAHRAANTVATSPLVKTALYGDANRGRLLMAVVSRRHPGRPGALLLCGWRRW